MAVASPDQVNLASFYENIIHAIRERAALAERMPSRRGTQLLASLGKGLGTGIAKGIESNIETEEYQRKKAIELAVQKQLDDYNKYKVGDEDIDNLVKGGVPKELAKRFKGLSIDPMKRKEFIENISGPFSREAFVSTLPEEQKAAAAVVPEKAAELKMLESVGKFEKTPTSAGVIRTFDVYGNPVLVNAAEIKKQFESGRSVVEVPSARGAGESGLTRIEKQDLRPIVQDLHEKSALSTQYRNQIASGDTIQKLLDVNNPASVRQIRTQLAILSGEGNRLTEQDVANQGGSQSLKARLGQVYEEMTTGKISKENLGYVKELVGITQKVRAKQLAEQFNGAISAASAFTPLETEEDLKVIEKSVGRDIPLILDRHKSYRIRMIAPDGVTKGTVSRDKVSEKLKQGFKFAY